jgi:DNA mismatch repair protein MutS
MEDKTMKYIHNRIAELKMKYPGYLLIFRCLDYYQAYNQDAEKIAKTLNIEITNIDGDTCCAFLCNKLSEYLPKMIRAGYRVAINEMREMPKKEQGQVSVELLNLNELTL